MKYLISLVVIFIWFYFILPPKDAVAQTIYTTEKLITIDIKRQLLTAWEGGRIKYQSKVSTGLPQSPTVKGSFKIVRKILVHDMKGYSPYKGYYHIKNVPYSLYFYRGYAIHGAYWHNNFGRPASNGCINLPVNTAKLIYDWAGLGTRVEIW